MQHSPKNVPVAEQNSSDIGNELWETASESSDNLKMRETKEDIEVEYVEPEVKRDTRKSFSSQRRSSDRALRLDAKVYDNDNGKPGRSNNNRTRHSNSSEVVFRDSNSANVESK